MNEEIIVEMIQLTEFFLIVVENNIFHGMIWNFESAKKQFCAVIVCFGVLRAFSSEFKHMFR